VLTAALATALAASGCPGEGVVQPPACSRIPGCDSPCCDQERQCLEIICEGASWICRREGSGHRWMRDAPCPPPDLGPDSAMSDGSIRCGTNAHQDKSGGCVCDQGFVDKDGTWTTGCEAPDPACSLSSCLNCPTGYCGNNAHCRVSINRCRCVDGDWLNTDKDWSNGCEAYTIGCDWDSCNKCYTGFCGAHANCMQNVCKCTVSGWYDCDKKWELSGCECSGGCNGSACK